MFVLASRPSVAVSIPVRVQLHVHTQCAVMSHTVLHPSMPLEDDYSEPPESLPPEEVVTPPELITMPSRFEQVQERGYIDVWWLYDDGGQTLYFTSKSNYCVTYILLLCDVHPITV